MREARESRQPTLHMMGFDLGKDLTEDTLLDDSGDIPGLVPTGERSFDFIQKEGHTQLAHLSARARDIIFGVLAGFEPIVFETREMPRMAPRHQYDMDIPQRPGSRPVASRPYSVAPHLKTELSPQIKSLLKLGIIRESHSFYSSPVLFAPKKDGKLRLCINYQRLNQQTERDPFPTPVVADLIASTRGSRMFSKLDLQAGFHQLRLQDCNQEKTAVSTPFGLFEWVTCPFGLVNTPG